MSSFRPTHGLRRVQQEAGGAAARELPDGRHPARRGAGRRTVRTTDRWSRHAGVQRRHHCLEVVRGQRRRCTSQLAKAADRVRARARRWRAQRVAARARGSAAPVSTPSAEVNSSTAIGGSAGSAQQPVPAAPAPREQRVAGEKGDVRAERARQLQQRRCRERRRRNGVEPAQHGRRVGAAAAEPAADRDVLVDADRPAGGPARPRPRTPPRPATRGWIRARPARRRASSGRRSAACARAHPRESSPRRAASSFTNSDSMP